VQCPKNVHFRPPCLQKTRGSGQVRLLPLAHRPEIIVFRAIQIIAYTSADSVYMLERITESSALKILCYSSALGQKIELEENLLKPVISGANIDRYECIEPNKVLLFPYSVEAGTNVLIGESEFEQEYPSIWRYLKQNEALLRARENKKFDDRSWYRFGRHQNLDKQEYSKIAVPRLIDRLKAIYDKKGEYYLDNVDVNGILLKVDSAYKPEYLPSLLNSRLMDFLFKKGSVKFRGEYYSANKQFIAPLPIKTISFSTSEEERKERVGEAIELYEKYMVDLEQKGHADERTEASAEHTRTVGGPVAGGKEGKVSGEHPGAGSRIHGVRGRTRKPDDAEGAHEESEEYNPAPRSTRFIESSLGIKSYAELAPYLAKEVERVIAALLDKSPDELKVTPEFICELHKDAFEVLFPSWAGRYRDRKITAGTPQKNQPPRQPRFL
jgi:TaqI-like C-terminal specificity domain